MVSKRKFFSIVIMMVVLLFLTQFSMVLRDQANQYDANASLSERKADGKEVIEQSKAERKDLSLLISEKSVLFIGDVSGAMGTEVKRWADYVKWDMFSVKSMDEYIQSKTHTGIRKVCTGRRSGLPGAFSETGSDHCLRMSGRSGFD